MVSHTIKINSKDMFVICSFYKFINLDNFKQIKKPLLELMQSLSIRGTILLAKEGFNGTISGLEENIYKILVFLKKYQEIDDIEYKISYSEKNPFKRTKVKLKKEIVTMGKDINPNIDCGIYVNPKDWNNLITDKDVILLDMRNNYEHEIGSFKGALKANIESFREIPDYIDENLDNYKGKKVAMFCTGGIRCEKSTSYLISKGFKDVYHLRGGILKYFKEVTKEHSMWEGSCFIFDDRVSVKHNLEPGNYDQCHACRRPITSNDKLDIKYEKGVSCPHCFGSKSKSQLKRYREREKQINLAKSRGHEHIGEEAKELLINKNKKY